MPMLRCDRDDADAKLACVGRIKFHITITRTTSHPREKQGKDMLGTNLRQIKAGSSRCGIFPKLFNAGRRL
jgi:hypothetical protein